MNRRFFSLVRLESSLVPKHTVNVIQALQRASQLHAQGRLGEAEKLYRQVLAADRRNADALHLLGVLLHQSGRTADGIESISRAIAITPQVAQYHQNLANIYRELNDPTALAECLRRIAALDPYATAPRLRLARVLQGELHRPADAVKAFREILAIDPQHGEALAGLATALHQTGDLSGALECYDKATQLCSNDSDVLSNFAIALTECGQFNRSVQLLERATELQPRNPVLLYNLGVAAMAGDLHDRAITAFERTIEIDPNYSQAYVNLALLSHRRGQLEASADFFLGLLKKNPQCAPAHNNLGLIRLWQGRQDQAIESMRQALLLDPDSEQCWDNLLMALLYQGDDDPGKLLEEHRAWGRRHEDSYPAHDYANDPSPERRLRIGYISPDFRDHSIRFFIEPVLAHHDSGAGRSFLLRQSAHHRRHHAAAARTRASLARYLPHK